MPEPWTNLSLAAKTAVVTGGASGIGLASAHLLSSRGARVAIIDWNDAGGRAAASVSRQGGSAMFCRADVSNSSEVLAAFDEVHEMLGPAGILVNCAAVQVLATLLETREEDWDRQQSVNLKGTFLCCKAAVAHMKSAGGGSIVNVSSVLGFVGDAALAAYGAMKGGMIALTKSLAIGFGGDNIRVNCVCPGDVNTPMVKEYFDGAPDPGALRTEVYSKYALRRIAEPQEIAEVVCFLASGASSFVTGSTVVVDGGLTSKCY